MAADAFGDAKAGLFAINGHDGLPRLRVPLPQAAPIVLQPRYKPGVPQFRLYAGTKRKLGRFNLQDGRRVAEPPPHTEDPQSIRVAHITDGSGAVDWLVSSTLSKGGFGKYRLMLKLNPGDAIATDSASLSVYGVKEFRTELWPSQLRFNANNERIGYKTQRVTVDSVLAEAARGWELHSSVRMQDIVVIDGKDYVSMQEMDGGDMLGLVYTLMDHPDHFDKTARVGIVLRYLECVGQDLVRFYNIDRTIHGDIKPENIFWNSRGEFVTGDLGGSIQADGAGMAEGGAHTWRYAAPELRTPDHVLYSNAVDVWAAGVSALQFWGTEPSPQTYSFLTGRKITPRRDVFDDRKNDRLPQLETLRKKLVSSRAKSTQEERMRQQAAAGNPFAKIFLRIQADTPELSDFLLKTISKKVETRAMAQDIVSFAQSQLTPELRSKVRRAMEQAAVLNIERHAVVDVLRAQAKQLLDARQKAVLQGVTAPMSDGTYF